MTGPFERATHKQSRKVWTCWLDVNINRHAGQALHILDVLECRLHFFFQQSILRLYGDHVVYSTSTTKPYRIFVRLHVQIMLHHCQLSIHVTFFLIIYLSPLFERCYKKNKTKQNKNKKTIKQNADMLLVWFN